VLLTFASTHTSLKPAHERAVRPGGGGPGLARELLAEIETVAAVGGWSDAPYEAAQARQPAARVAAHVARRGARHEAALRAPHTFRGGLHVPRGTFACMPIAAIENDAAHVRGGDGDPAVFDALRYYRLRLQAPDEHAARACDFASPTRTSLSFGYGRNACPGRFFAALSSRWSSSSC
ncbi:hypothetical protein F4775DRAFT_597845, partial [Biscogniauxia sp. FL1348]